MSPGVESRICWPGANRNQTLHANAWIKDDNSRSRCRRRRADGASWDRRWGRKCLEQHPPATRGAKQVTDRQVSGRLQGPQAARLPSRPAWPPRQGSLEDSGVDHKGSPRTVHSSALGRRAKEPGSGSQRPCSMTRYGEERWKQEWPPRVTRAPGGSEVTKVTRALEGGGGEAKKERR